MIDQTKVYNLDCVDGMKNFPDGYFDLAIVDPPYGINIDKHSQFKGGKRSSNKPKKFNKGDWDNSIPGEEYFEQLFRVSKNQIIWGANYMTEFLPPSMGWIFWDKGQRLAQSDGELAFTSFNRALRVFECNRIELLIEPGNTIHPTQKPIKLYKWLLKNYAAPGDKILDTHLGSGASRIAAFEMNFDFTGYEIDEQYFEAQENRFRQHKSQLKLQFV